MARRLMCTGPGEIGWEEFADRTPGPGEIRVVHSVGTEKHGTMQAFLKGYGNQRGKFDGENHMHYGEGAMWNWPLPLGNMQIGIVTEIGEGVTEFAVGDTAAVSAPFAPHSVTPIQWAYRLGRDTKWKDALLQDPGEFALGALRDGNVRIGDRVAVSGLGAIGLTTIQLAKAAGAWVVASDPLPARRKAALASGADAVLDATSPDVGGQIRQLTGKKGVDVAIDFSGAVPAIQAAIRGVGYMGTVVLGAFPPPYTQGFDFGGEAHMNRIRLQFTRACSDPNPDHPRWNDERIRRAVWQMILDNKLNGEVILDEPVPFDSIMEVYPEIASKPNEHIKLTVKY